MRQPVDPKLLQVVATLLSQGVVAPDEQRLDECGQLVIEQGPILAWISVRPPYCDRGAFQVLAESADPSLLTIDHADGFPRYYFHAESLVREFDAWLSVRGEQWRNKLAHRATPP